MEKEKDAEQRSSSVTLRAEFIHMTFNLPNTARVGKQETSAGLQTSSCDVTSGSCAMCLCTLGSGTGQTQGAQVRC